MALPPIVPIAPPLTGPFAGMTVAQLQAALNAAQAAYLDLLTGQAIATVSYSQGDGAKSVTRRVTSAGECLALIAQLQRALGMPGSVRRPMRFAF